MKEQKIVYDTTGRDQQTIRRKSENDLGWNMGRNLDGISMKKEHSFEGYGSKQRCIIQETLMESELILDLW